MYRYFTKTQKSSVGSTSVQSPNPENVEHISDVEVQVDDIVSDPSLRKLIESFDASTRDRVRRGYIFRGPCQSIGHSYPRKKSGEDNRCFRNVWFDGRSWLEYSIAKDAAFCFYCYLFRRSNVRCCGDESFVKNGFVNWKKATAKFADHVGGVNSSHNRVRELFKNFKNQRQSVTRALTMGKVVMDNEYRNRLTASLRVVRFLLRLGLSFRGDDDGSCISCLNPSLSFISFNVDKLVHLTHLYPDDFTLTGLSLIRQELQTYVQDLRNDARFKDLDNLGNLGKKMIETLKHKAFLLAYRLIELTLILPVATASVELVFSAMNVVKTRLRNKMGDEWMNDCLVVYLEKEVFVTLDDKPILQRFQNMDNRRCQLSHLSS